ncbi:hypothetical protein XELAEV_18013625mg [Xenopus laevis]|uniref:Uncharacterized protein n=1 Tax=Xenopus laevis TaxID=8355 RepID=A0A974DQZ7_XENLA|nr:hypothetical protein XELAEV_18013625mg [Xenopus laevis]
MPVFLTRHKIPPTEFRFPPLTQTVSKTVVATYKKRSIYWVFYNCKQTLRHQCSFFFPSKAARFTSETYYYFFRGILAPHICIYISFVTFKVSSKGKTKQKNICP